MKKEASISIDNDVIQCKGYWTVSTIASLVSELETFVWPEKKTLRLNGLNIEAMDSAGAWLLIKCIKAIKTHSQLVSEDHKPVHQSIIRLVSKKMTEEVLSVKRPKEKQFLYRVGKEAHQKLRFCDGFIVMLGSLTLHFLRACLDWRRFNLSSIAKVIDITGIYALPIVGLLSFLIGIVLAYQMGIQLQTYGANVFIVYLTGMATQREFSPLITAIIVAGRTTSSFTAQLGSMKVNEEIDALKTMAISPTEILVLPKIIGLLVVFPILVFWSDVFATLGSMVMSKFMLGVNYLDFVHRLKESLGMRQYLLGMVKAPVFAFIIALVGCYHGFIVGNSANSVGLQTTKSVVQAIFLIIVADAAFAIAYSWLGL